MAFPCLLYTSSGIVKPIIAKNVADEIEEGCSDLKSVEIPAIELMIYEKLIAKKQKLTARAYEGYRSCLLYTSYYRRKPVL